MARAATRALGVRLRPAAPDGAGLDAAHDHQGNVFQALDRAFEGTGCQVLADGAQILADEISAIPDAVVSCAPRRRLFLASSKRPGRRFRIHSVTKTVMGELATPRAAATTIAHSELGI